MMRAAVIVALCVWASSAGASDLNVENERGSFADQASKVRTELSDGETYREIAPQDRSRVLQLLDQMESELADVQDVNALPEGKRVEVFNHQEAINAILTEAREDSRLVCRRERPTGSNRPTNVCLTKAERERARLQARDYMNIQRSPTMAPGN